MNNLKESIRKLNVLYDYGETTYSSSLKYLIEKDFLIKHGESVVVNKRWIQFSGKVEREDFISSLLCYHPKVLDALLQNTYKEAKKIAASGDSKALFEYINLIPKFAQRTLNLKNQNEEGSSEIREVFFEVFKGYPQYLQIMNLLRVMQLVEEEKESNIQPLGEVPNSIWIKGVTVASNIDLKPLKQKNKYTLTPFEFKHKLSTPKINKILSYPLKTILVVLGMIIEEYKKEQFEGLSFKPINPDNPYIQQEVMVHTWTTKGVEIRISDLNTFVYNLCVTNGFNLFPDKVPVMDKLLFQLIDEGIFEFKDDSYVLSAEMDDIIYASNVFMIKHADKFKNLLKENIEEIRRMS
ncbi:hypothetical protein BD780_003486 [Clostridium tetanomorphum]|uniref:hypothetical protein n=1 Tax=Clostridium tetanomorphum TaxID=1553 RepID=UPI00045194AE|nr:hypothetical protein [Clostridium tetanomorphum]KAJ51226.1 hypothetical protein CTM_13938 [Clostridium tetanomorphum DSM 665]MBP1863685.1 hypothetical protein [Clostridium tetanomorphum]NRS86261.1 hypothetical protein [Clostridium tetanomorphum]SQC00732.1 Uncharacterised protein [Clostridium tetanomorphum]